MLTNDHMVEFLIDLGGAQDCDRAEFRRVAWRTIVALNVERQRQAKEIHDLRNDLSNANLRAHLAETELGQLRQQIGGGR